jgi:hypothetical protein
VKRRDLVEQIGAKKEQATFIRKRRALVFSTEGDEILSEETLKSILEETREKRDEVSAGQLPAKKHGK